jgi:hypothetical protein
MKTQQYSESSFDSVLLGLGFKNTKALEISRLALNKKNTKSNSGMHAKEFL